MQTTDIRAIRAALEAVEQTWLSLPGLTPHQRADFALYLHMLQRQCDDLIAPMVIYPQPEYDYEF